MSSILTHPADALAQVFDLLSEVEGVDEIVRRCRSERAAEIDGLRARVVAEAALPEMDAAADTESLVVALLALDAALAEASPDTRTSSGGLPEIWGRWCRAGRFDSGNIEGAVLPRRSRSDRAGPPEELADALEYTVRVRPEVWSQVAFVKVSATLELKGNARQRLSVAVAPVSEDLDDFRIDEIDDDGELAYSIAPAPPIEARIPELLAALDDAGAAVAVLPESMLDNDAVDLWRETCRSARRDSELRWILIGTGPVGPGSPPPNRALLLDRGSGRVIGTQDKRRRYNIADHSIDQYGMRGVLPTAGDHTEYIERGRTLTVVESSAGRFCVLICEDIHHALREDFELIRSVAPSHVLVPVFAREILRHDWMANDRSSLGEVTGAGVVVSNSLAVARRRSEGGLIDPRYENEWGSALFLMPYHPGRNEDPVRADHAMDVRVGYLLPGL